MTAGKEFDILTVSIDPAESQERSALFKQKYLDQYQRPEAREGWHFLRGKTMDVERLANSVGFKYAYVKERKEYAHTAGLMVLSPEGTVTRYLYGIMFDPRDVRLALVEAAEGKVGSTVDRILLYCFHYDSSAGKYAPVAANIMRDRRHFHGDHLGGGAQHFLDKRPAKATDPSRLGRTQTHVVETSDKLDHVARS